METCFHSLVSLITRHLYGKKNIRIVALTYHLQPTGLCYLQSISPCEHIFFSPHPVPRYGRAGFHHISPVFVYDAVEELAVPPACGEVVAAHAVVPFHHPLGPQQQLLLGCHVVWLAIHLDVGDLGGGGGSRGLVIQGTDNVPGSRPFFWQHLKTHENYVATSYCIHR